MRKTITIAVVFVVLVIVLIMFVLHSRSPFGKSNSEFHAKLEKEITRIELLQGNERLILEKSGDDWLINGTVNARRGGINFITTILTDARIKSPISQEVFNNEIVEQGVEPVIVRVFEGRRLLKSIRVYKTLSNVYGNIMKIKESSKPFIVHVPGYEVNIGAAFNVRPQFWQPYTIFNMMPSEIGSIRFENLQDTSASFSIIKTENTYTLQDNKGEELTGFNPSLIIRYISYFTFVPFELWAFELPDQDKVLPATDVPLYRITVITSEGVRTVLNLWQIIKTENNEQIIDTDRLIGSFELNDNFFIVRYFDIDPVLKKVAYFFMD